jgi:hypothetical protein
MKSHQTASHVLGELEGKTVDAPPVGMDGGGKRASFWEGFKRLIGRPRLLRWLIGASLSWSTGDVSMSRDATP